jgi:hypothetical protein
MASPVRCRPRFWFLILAALCLQAADPELVFPLFRENGSPRGWIVRHWANVADQPEQPCTWNVKEGVLHGSDPRGTWLISDREYSDFILQFEFRLPERGNSGVGLRFPLQGDPAFDGLEVQMVDPRYYPSEYAFEPAELTGGIYKALPPRAQVFKALEWNQYEITCRGSQIKVVLNGTVIHDTDLAQETRALERGAPLSQRPRRGHIGFQELSRGGGHVEIRNAQIKELLAEKTD